MEIMFINKQALFNKTDKDIRFHGLVPLEKITKEECYRYLDVVMRYYNKAVFLVKRIEYDDEFKPIMDEVSDDMGMENNYANPDDRITET